jgi:hypothetical protein
MYVSGEPRAMKVACVVRRGTDEKGQMMYLVSGLPYNILDRGLGRSPRETVTTGTFRGTLA